LNNQIIEICYRYYFIVSYNFAATVKITAKFGQVINLLHVARY